MDDPAAQRGYAIEIGGWRIGLAAARGKVCLFGSLTEAAKLAGRVGERFDFPQHVKAVERRDGTATPGF